MKRCALLTTASALVLFACCGRAVADAEKPKSKSIDVAICLDVSGSMQHLIESAKVKLWNIVNELAKMQPAPKLRVALYSYGRDNYDPKLGWVRKECELTDDLDLLYQKLFALTTNGGTELVTRVCWDAVDQLQWSTDKDALRMIFVAGNEPASQDKRVSLKQLADRAKKDDVFVNPVYCGNPNHRDAVDWKELAKLAGGNFNSIDQKGRDHRRQNSVRQENSRPRRQAQHDIHRLRCRRQRKGPKPKGTIRQRAKSRRRGTSVAGDGAKHNALQLPSVGPRRPLQDGQEIRSREIARRTATRKHAQNDTERTHRIRKIDDQQTRSNPKTDYRSEQTAHRIRAKLSQDEPESCGSSISRSDSLDDSCAGIEAGHRRAEVMASW